MSSTPSQKPLVVSGLSHSYRAHAALKQIDLEIEPGALFALLGPNGAGKTTLVRAIAGRLSPSAGAVSVCGCDPARDQAARGRIGLVPQHLALYDSLTPRENLEVFGGLFGLSGSAAAARAEELLALTGLEDKASARVSGLSGGMCRRLNIAAAIMHRPALLLLDEPSVGVDIRALEGVVSLIRRLKDEGYAILMTTHDMLLAEAVCDRVGILKAGEMLAQGPLDQLVEQSFARAQIVSGVFTRPVEEDDARHALDELGLAPQPGGLVWEGRADDGQDVMRRVSLLQATPPIRQLGLRQPGLTDLYRTLTDEPVVEKAVA